MIKVKDYESFSIFKLFLQFYIDPTSILIKYFVDAKLTKTSLKQSTTSELCIIVGFIIILWLNYTIYSSYSISIGFYKIIIDWGIS
jgi:hypothetical protein